MASAARTSARCDSACGVLPAWRPRGRVVLLARAARRRCVNGDEPVHERDGVGEPSRAGVLLDEPERAGEERMLAGRQPVDPALGAVAQQEPVVQQVALDRPTVPSMRGSSAAQKPTCGSSSSEASTSVVP